MLKITHRKKMTITIEKYQIMIWFTMVAFIAITVNEILGGPSFIFLFLVVWIVAAVFYGALVALTNIKSKEIKAYWKKEDKYLLIPFQSGQGMIAYDEDGQRYKLGMFFIPKKTN